MTSSDFGDRVVTLAITVRNFLHDRKDGDVLPAWLTTRPGDEVTVDASTGIRTVNVSAPVRRAKLAEQAKVLLGGGWSVGLLHEYLAAAEEGTPQQRALGAKAIIEALLRWLPVPAAEVDAWVRGPLGGNIYGLTVLAEQAGVDLVGRWRAVSAPGRAADAITAVLGEIGRIPAGALRYEATGTDLIQNWPDGSGEWLAWGEQHLPARLRNDVDLLSPVGAAMARLLAGGWTCEQVAVLTLASPAGPGRVAPRQAADLAMPVEILAAWQDAFDVALPVLWEQREVLHQIRAVWQAIGVPVAVVPYCAAAGMSPEEAIEVNGRGDLQAGSVRMLASLLRRG